MTNINDSNWKDRLVSLGVNPTHKPVMKTIDKARDDAYKKAEVEYNRRTKGNTELAKLATEAFNAIAAGGTVSLVAFMALVLILLLVVDTIAVYGGLVPVMGAWKSFLTSITLVMALFVIIFLSASLHEIVLAHELKENTEEVQRHLEQAQKAHNGLIRMEFALSLLITVAAGLGRLAFIVMEADNMPALDGLRYLRQTITLFDAITVFVLMVITPVLIWVSREILSVIVVNFTRLTGGVQVVAIGSTNSVSLETLAEQYLDETMHAYADYLETNQKESK